MVPATDVAHADDTETNILHEILRIGVVTMGYWGLIPAGLGFCRCAGVGSCGLQRSGDEVGRHFDAMGHAEVAEGTQNGLVPFDEGGLRLFCHDCGDDRAGHGEVGRNDGEVDWRLELGLEDGEFLRECLREIGSPEALGLIVER